MGTGCSTCHEAALDAHPNPHGAGWRSRHCNSCHSDTYELERCGLCHVDGIDAHPDPHRAGWRNSHCFNCHTDAGNDECSVCHPGGNNVRVHDGGVWPWWHDPYSNQTDCELCHHP